MNGFEHAKVELFKSNPNLILKKKYLNPNSNMGTWPINRFIKICTTI